MGCKNCDRQQALLDVDVAHLVAEQLALEREITPTEVQEQRLQICQQCPFLMVHTCQKCGCFVAFRVALPSKVCPLGKW